MQKSAFLIRAKPFGGGGRFFLIGGIEVAGADCRSRLRLTRRGGAKLFGAGLD